MLFVTHDLGIVAEICDEVEAKVREAFKAATATPQRKSAAPAAEPIAPAVDAVFVSIGREPASAFLDPSLKDADGYVIADESTRTAIPGVFAVGDVRTKELRQVVTAVADGAVAAHYAEKYLGGAV